MTTIIPSEKDYVREQIEKILAGYPCNNVVPESQREAIRKEMLAARDRLATQREESRDMLTKFQKRFEC